MAVHPSWAGEDGRHQQRGGKKKSGLGAKTKYSSSRAEEGNPEEVRPNNARSQKGTRVGHGVDNVREILEEHEQSRRVGSRKDTRL